jgi:hypothetical protein
MQIDLSDKEMRFIYDTLRFVRRKCERETEELLTIAEWTESEHSKIISHQENSYKFIDDLCNKVKNSRSKIPSKPIVEHEEQ